MASTHIRRHLDRPAWRAQSAVAQELAALEARITAREQQQANR